RRFMPDSAKDASVFGLSHGLQRRAGIKNAAASGTKNVPRHIEHPESRAVHKRRKDIIFIEPAPGGKGEGIDAAKLAIRRVVDELFDCSHWFRLCRLPQSIEEILSVVGKFHGLADWLLQHSYRVTRKTESKRRGLSAAQFSGYRRQHD